MTTTEIKFQERLAYCVEHLQICVDQYGTFAKVPSTSDHNFSYRVDIDETHGIPFATRCSCASSKKGECPHFKAVDVFYQQIAAIFEKEEEVKEPVIRQELHDVNRVYYMVLDGGNYHSVQMENGRGASCIDHLGKKCQGRVKHPAVPCQHMYTANLAEEKHRQQEMMNAYVQNYGFTGPILADFTQLVQEEQNKCTEVFRAVMRQPIDEIEGTSEWFRAAEKRGKEAEKARLKQKRISQARIDAFVQQLQPAA